MKIWKCTWICGYCVRELPEYDQKDENMILKEEEM